MDVDQFLEENDDDEVVGVIECLFTESGDMIVAQGGVTQEDIRKAITVLEARLTLGMPIQ